MTNLDGAGRTATFMHITGKTETVSFDYCVIASGSREIYIVHQTFTLRFTRSYSPNLWSVSQTHGMRFVHAILHNARKNWPVVSQERRSVFSRDSDDSSVHRNWRTSSFEFGRLEAMLQGSANFCHAVGGVLTENVLL